MLKEKVLQHDSQAERVKCRAMISGASQRHNNALRAFYSCPTPCRRADVRVQWLQGRVVLQVTALQQRELAPSAQQGRGGEYLLSRA